MCCYIGRINIMKMTIISKAIYTFNTIPIKLPVTFFKELARNVYSLYGITHQKTLIANVILRMKNGTERNRLPDFKV